MKMNRIWFAVLVFIFLLSIVGRTFADNIGVGKAKTITFRCVICHNLDGQGVHGKPLAGMNIDEFASRMFFHNTGPGASGVVGIINKLTNGDLDDIRRYYNSLE